MNRPDISILLGKTLVSCSASDVSVKFETLEGKKYILYHDQDCCECVYIEDIDGDLQDLVGSPITLADESTSGEQQPDRHCDDSFTWTFYRLATVKGYVNIKWLGESNGYYSEAVDLIEL